ncbi:hypothetical protein ACFQVC_08900 [Streptomyces monticola]|uniref:Uncharacterized protein n=1 Tax=Streptomyces monticola TaxID=2666263 RepID=A0ABW2JFQ9_9ACTN
MNGRLNDRFDCCDCCVDGCFDGCFDVDQAWKPPGALAETRGILIG